MPINPYISCIETNKRMDKQMHKSINTMFPGYKGTKTYGGAQARLDKVLDRFEDVFFTSVIIESVNGYIPIIICNDKNEEWVGMLVQCNICVTKA